jgi:predicted nucleic acid-binding protein
MNRMRSKEWEWIGSDVLLAELENTPDRERRAYLLELAACAHTELAAGENEISRAMELGRFGFKAFDALHIACAESAQVEVLLTTDDKLLRTAQREQQSLHVQVANPLSWLMERV